MGTRSVVGVPYGDGFRGRYCHWDGYPTYNGVHLWRMIQRDGIEKVVNTIVFDNYQWSSLDHCKNNVVLNNGETLKNVVRGYGSIYTDVTEDDWITYTGNASDDLWCTEWAYILDVNSKTMSIMKIDNNQVRLLTTINVENGDEPDWENLQDSGNDISIVYYATNKENV
jgi:hypothetical protein